MSIDSKLRAICALACLSIIGLFVTVTSTAALNSVTHEPDPVCGDAACGYVAQHHETPDFQSDFGYSRAIHTGALFLAGE